MEKVNKDLNIDDDIAELLQDDVESRLKELNEKKSNRKNRFRKTKKIILLALLVLGSVYFLSDASKVKSLSVQGTVFYDQDTILEKAGLTYNTRYILKPAFYIKWKLENDPFIASADVYKQMDGVISIAITDATILGYRVDEKTMAIFADGSQEEITSDTVMSIANYALIGNFTEEQLTKILEVFYNEENPVKTDVIAMISEIQPYATSYDENMVKIIMRDGNVLYGPYNSIRLLNYYKQAMASLKTHPTCLSMDEATSSIVSLGECPGG